MAWDYHKPKTQVNGVRIVELVTPGLRSADTVYLVACLECGHRWEITHYQLAKRARSNACTQCAREQARQTRLLTNAARRESPPPPPSIRGTPDANGWFWASLGPLGFRSAAGEPPRQSTSTPRGETTADAA
jgi:hypothetical protein